MKNYYSTLGVNESASDEEIKKAFRKLAATHHPDKGGDDSKFKEINEAYDNLKTPKKRQEYDTLRKYGSGFGKTGDNFSFNMNDMFSEDVFEDFFSGFSFNNPGGRTRVYRRNPRTNKSVNIKLALSLKEIMQMQERVVSVKLPSGREEIVNIKLPIGCRNNSVFKYKGLGDDTHNNLPRGDLMVNVSVLDSDGFVRNDNDIITERSITCFEAIRGTDIDIKLLDDSVKRVHVPAGTQPGTILQLKSLGLPMPERPTIRGNVLIKIHVTIPRLNERQIEQIKGL